MQRYIVVAMLSLLSFAPGALSQDQPDDQMKTHLKVPIIAAKPEDVSSIEAIVTASYETISGGIGVPRQWGRERTLNDVHARFVAAEVDPKTGQTRVWSTSDQEFADQTDESMVKDGFTEQELGHVIHRYGNVASVLSSYEGKSQRTGKADRGVNIFELYNDGKRWWILSIVWDSERAGNPIPAELLRKN
jgi:hypothetical protein